MLDTTLHHFLRLKIYRMTRCFPNQKIFANVSWRLMSCIFVKVSEIVLPQTSLNSSITPDRHFTGGQEG
jgi:hypothetical protein